MKKSTLLVAALLAAACATSTSAAMFTDFENYTSFEEGDNPAYTLNDPADYWDGEWNGGGDNGDTLTTVITDGVGFNGSKGLAVSSSGANNVGLYVFANESNGIVRDHTGAQYLRVWADFSEVEFRKANFGLVDGMYCLYSTDEVDTSWECKFYYSEDGAEWTEMVHGDDGCFGDAQGSYMLGMKGWFAVPVADFTIRNNANWEGYEALTPAPVNDVVGVYLFWDYSDNGVYTDTPFILDNMEFVADYTVFDYPLTAEEPAPAPEEPVVEEVPAVEETPVVEETPAPEVPAEEVVEEPAPEVVEEPVPEVVEEPAEEVVEEPVKETVEEAPATFDLGVMAAVAAVITGAGVVLGKKRR